ncbi:protease inhibitor I42 family protein [Chloroflexota bacterium]
MPEFLNHKETSGQTIAPGSSGEITSYIRNRQRVCLISGCGRVFTNPTTGFQWEEAQISNEAVLKQVDRRFISPERGTPPPPGTPGQDVWTFEAIQKRSSTVSIRYSRPWEGVEKGEWTFTLAAMFK